MARRWWRSRGLRVPVTVRKHQHRDQGSEYQGGDDGERDLSWRGLELDEDRGQQRTNTDPRGADRPVDEGGVAPVTRSM